MYVTNVTRKNTVVVLTIRPRSNVFRRRVSVLCDAKRLHCERDSSVGWRNKTAVFVCFQTVESATTNQLTLLATSQYIIENKLLPY